MFDYNPAIAHPLWIRDNPVVVEDDEYQYTDAEDIEPQYTEVDEEQPTQDQYSDLENQPQPTEPEDPLSLFTMGKRARIPGREVRHEPADKPKPLMHFQRPQAPTDPNQVIRQIVNNQVRAVIRQAPQRHAVPAPQAQAPARTFESYRYTRRAKPVVSIRDPVITNTNLSSSIPKKKSRRRK
jgi:hypothetical protein